MTNGVEEKRELGTFDFEMIDRRSSVLEAKIVDLRDKLRDAISG